MSLGKGRSNESAGARRPWMQRAFYVVARAFCRITAVVFFRYVCRGREHIPAEGPALVCANHQSYFDPVAVGVAFSRRLNYLARSTLFRSRLFGGLIRYLDAIPIERDGMGLAGLKETMRRLRRDEMVLIFPEGTRSPDGGLQPIKPGFLVVARRCRVPLLPVGVDGTYQAWPRDARWPRLTKVAVVIGRPIGPEELEKLTDDEAGELLQQRLAACWEEARRLRKRRRWGRSTLPRSGSTP